MIKNYLLPRIKKYFRINILQVILFFLISLNSITRIQAQNDDNPERLNTSTQDRRALELFTLTNKYIMDKKYPEAEQLLIKALKYDSNYVNALMRLGLIYNMQGKYDLEEKQYIKVITILPEFPDVYFNYARVLMHKLQYDKAQEMFNQYLMYDNTPKEYKIRAKKYITICEFRDNAMKHPVPFKPENLGRGVNSDLDEYWPVLTADEQTLYFTRKLVVSEDKSLKMNRFNEDVYYSTFDDGQWSQAHPLPGFLNSTLNEGALSITPDGKTLYFTICGNKEDRADIIGWCDIYVSELKNGEWQVPVNLGPPINTEYKETQPSISFDGKTLYFSSNRPGTLGKLDIWKSTKDDKGKWSEPVNLGKTINTPENEQSPFIHPDDNTLYFSSDGRLGMGGADLYMARRNPWNPELFDSVRNLGYPINTDKDEISLFVSSNGKHGYFASGDPDNPPGLDIYRFDLYKGARPKAVCYLKGNVIDIRDKAPIGGAKLQLIDLDSGKIVLESFSQENTGKYLAAIPSNSDYVLNVSKQGYMFFSDNLSLKGCEPSSYVKDIPLHPIQVGEKIVLHNIFYDFDSTALKPRSIVELKKVIEFMNQYPNIKVELGGHTDIKGTHLYNINLSNRRAEAVYNYLINTGKIKKERLTYKGYGETQPIDNNNTDQGRANNRRTEFKITGV